MWLFDACETQEVSTKNLTRGKYCLLIHSVDASIPTPNLSAGKSGVVQVRICHLPNEKGCCLFSVKLSILGCSTALPDTLSKGLHEHCLFTSAFSLHWWSSHISRMTVCTGTAFLTAAGVAQSQTYMLFSLDCVVLQAQEQKPSSAYGSSLSSSSQQYPLSLHAFPEKEAILLPAKPVHIKFHHLVLLGNGNLHRPCQEWTPVAVYWGLELESRTWKAADMDVLWRAEYCRCKCVQAMLIFQRALSKMGLTTDTEGQP